MSKSDNKKFKTLYDSLNKETIDFLLNEDNQDRLIKYINSLSPNNSIYAWIVYFIKDIRNIKGTPDAFDGCTNISEINKLVPDNNLTTIDTLSSTSKLDPLSANQGRVLRNMLDDLSDRVEALHNINLSKFIEYKGKSLYEVNTNLYGKTMKLGINGYSLKNLFSNEIRYYSTTDEENYVKITNGIPKPGGIYTLSMDLPENQKISVQLLCGNVPISSKVKFTANNGRNIIQIHTYSKVYFNDDYYLKLNIENPPFTLSNMMLLEGNIRRTDELPEYVDNITHITNEVNNEYILNLISIGQNKLDVNKLNNINNWDREEDNYGFRYFKISNLNPNKQYIIAINKENVNANNSNEIVLATYKNKIYKFLVRNSNTVVDYVISYPNMFGELYIGAKLNTSTAFNNVKSILNGAYIVQSNFDMENNHPYIESRKEFKIPNHIVSDPSDESFYDRIYQDESGNVKVNYKYAMMKVPINSYIVKYGSSSGDFIENDRTELFRLEFYDNKEIDHLSLHNLSSEFTYVSPYLSTYIDIGEFITIEKEKDKPVPLYVDDDFTELLVNDDKALYITPIKSEDEYETGSIEPPTNLSNKLEELELFRVVINISKSKIDKVMRENPNITERTEALRKYIEDKDLTLFLEYKVPHDEQIKISGFDIPIFEEGSTITTGSITRPIFDFVIPNSLGTIIRSQVTQINNLYTILYEEILPHIIEV